MRDGVRERDGKRERESERDGISLSRNVRREEKKFSNHLRNYFIYGSNDSR